MEGWGPQRKVFNLWATILEVGGGGGGNGRGGGSHIFTLCSQRQPLYVLTGTRSKM